MMRIAQIALTLGELRNLCDYDPSYRITLASAQAALTEARETVAALPSLDEDERKDFIVLLAFGRGR